MINETPEERIKSAIAIVNKERFLFYYHYIYYIISLFLPLMALFYTKIKIKGVILKCSEDIRSIKSTNANMLIVNKGINFFGLFIPYEHIFRFGHYNNKVNLVLFAKFDKLEEKKIKFNLDKCEKLHVSFHTDTTYEAKSCVNKLKSNMYYYLKYYKYDLKCVEYV